MPELLSMKITPVMYSVIVLGCGVIVILAVLCVDNCRKDINNIRTAFNIGCVYKDASDHTPVVVSVEELQAMGDDGPVILYKPQGVLPAPDEPSGILAQNMEDIQVDVEFGDSTSAANDGSALLESVRKQVHSKLQQCIVDLSVCNDTDALLRALKHATAAHASMHAVSKHRAARLPVPVRKKLPANKKLDKQLRFCGTKAKRPPRRQVMREPSTDELTSVKQLLVGQEAESRASQVSLSYFPTGETSAAGHDAIVQAVFFMDAGSIDMPYCEEVTTVYV